MELAKMDIEPNRVTSETTQWIKQETAKDLVLASLCNVSTSEWPAERKEISVYDGVAYLSHQVIVPSSLQEEMLQKIHKVHQGADSRQIGLECKQKSRKNAFHVDFVPNTLKSNHKNLWNLTQ